MKKDEKELYYVQNIPVPETPRPAGGTRPWQETKVIGRPLPRVDAYERVSGKAVYPSDVILADMLFCALLRCPHPNAVVRSVDARDAKAMVGVRAVMTGEDKDADILWPWSPDIKTMLFDAQCRFEGEVVAAVAAETPYQAWDAVRAIKVRYDVLPFVQDERLALDGSSARVHKDGNTVKIEKYERGDVAKGFAGADVVLEQTYRNESEVHTPMELHGCVARWDGDSLTLWESTQGVYSIQAKVAEVLRLPLAKVRVIGKYMGGGFGSKLQADKLTVIAALLAKRTARPVKMFLSREETFIAAGNRPPGTMKLKAGVKKDGTLLALEFSGVGASGAYPAGGAALMDWLVRDLYTCSNVRTELTDVYINAGPARPFRAPGHPQSAWALEQMMDALAEAIAMDPVELRLRNIPTVSQARPGSPPYTSTGLRECLEKGAAAFGWKEARGKSTRMQKDGIRRGVGVAAGLWVAGGGNPPSTVIVKLFADGSANLNMGASDIGTGTKTVMAMVVAEELGIRPEMLQIEHADTDTTQYATSSGGSKTVPTESPAVRAAALDVKRQLLELAGQDLKLDAADLELSGDEIVSLKDPTKKIKVSAVTGLKKRGVIMGVGYRGPNPEGKVVNPFAAQFCEVEVNTRTGEARVLRFVAAHDSGRVMDRLTYDNQVFGGIVMGIGFGLTEARVLDQGQTGKMVNRNWHDYKLPTALDVPANMTSIPVDLGDSSANTTGAKGLGEPVTIPTAAAIANAVYHATGVRVTETPMNAVRLCRLFTEKKRT
jgi:xanthine dehydrogenase YagR molybdenum-binding subunit